MPIIISKADFPGTRAELQEAVEGFAAALDAHAQTENEPAPWPDYDVLRRLVGSDAGFILAGELAEDEPLPDHAMTYRDHRRAAYISELGEEGSFATTVGDVIDDLIREVRALADRPATPEFADLVSKVDAIKARFPKPQ
jgi:hypothetical protein